jgi:hypothetical protein
MGRRIVTATMHAAGAGAPRIDGYFDQVLKYIPGDIVSAWVLVVSLLDAAPSDIPKPLVGWIAFVVGTILTLFWMLFQTSEPIPTPPAYRQSALASIAFVIWVAAVGFPFTTIPHYHQVYGSLLLVLYTLVTPIINKALLGGKP